MLHKYDDNPAGAHHCVELPAQIDPFPVIVLDGSVFKFNVLLDEDVQPFASVTVTV